MFQEGTAWMNTWIVCLICMLMETKRKSET